MNKTLVILSAAVAMLTAGIAQAQNPTPKRIRGEIAAVTDTQLTVKERGGETLQVKLGEPLTVNAVIKADLASIAPGTYVGVASLPQSDGVLKAVEVLIFPDAMRGTGEGHFAWDLTPETMMTNATVETVGGAGIGPDLETEIQGRRENGDCAGRRADRDLSAERPQHAEDGCPCLHDGHEAARRHSLRLRASPSGRTAWCRRCKSSPAIAGG